MTAVAYQYERKQKCKKNSDSEGAVQGQTIHYGHIVFDEPPQRLDLLGHREPINCI